MAVLFKALLFLPFLFGSALSNRSSQTGPPRKTNIRSDLQVGFEQDSNARPNDLGFNFGIPNGDDNNNDNADDTPIFPFLPGGFFGGGNGVDPAPSPDAVNPNPNPVNNNGSGRGAKKPDFKTNYLGGWKVDSDNAGVSTMHIQLMPNNKAIWYDTTNLGPSAIKLAPEGNSRVDLQTGEEDFFAHGVEYDIETANVRPLKILNDPWCSSGGLATNGDLISTGGYLEGRRAVRTFTPCENCEFTENTRGLSSDRWYATNIKLEDGSWIVVGGRRAYNYEIIPPHELNFPIKQVGLPFLDQTTDEFENNLYPFVYLLPDGHVFIFANNRAILIKPATGEIIREYPVLPGGSRSYPASGQSALLPIKLSKNPLDGVAVEVEILICGGNIPKAFGLAEGNPKRFVPALNSCGRIKVTDENPQWEMENMPSGRVMGDLLILPTGDLLMINGARKGTSGWGDGDNPNLTPALYRPKKNNGQRFKELAPTTIPRMYHSASALLPDGKVLVGGSNPNPNYRFDGKFPTELRIEKFSPPYLDPKLQIHRPEIIENMSTKLLTYGKIFHVSFKLNAAGLEKSDLELTMYAPPFTTHGFSHNQRLLVLPVTQMRNGKATAVAPPSGKLAPPGYYLLYLVHRGVPSRGMWIHIQ